MKREPVRSRRLLFNCDGYSVWQQAGGNIDAWLENVFTGLTDSHVDALFWCDGAGGIYGFVPDPKKHPQHHQALGKWIAAIENALTPPPKYAAEPFGRVADYPSRWETPSFASYCSAHHGICSFTIETPYGLIGDLLLTRERYREAGERMATGIVETLCGTP